MKVFSLLFAFCKQAKKGWAAVGFVGVMALAYFVQAVLVPQALGTGLTSVGPIYSGPELDYQPSIIRKTDGQLMVVFERIRLADFYGDLYVTFSSDGGASWTAPHAIITDTLLNERHPALVQLAPDSFVLFYLVGDSGGYRIHRATSIAGVSWATHGAIDLGWSTTGEINPAVIRQADGALTMTYHRLSGPSYIAQSADDGVTWDHLKTQVSNGNAQLPRLARRESDGLYLVTYQVGGSDLDMYAKASTDPYNWNVAQVPLSTSINSHDSQPIVLEDGTFLVVYAMTPVSYFDLFYQTSRDGINWSPQVQVTKDPTHYDTQPHPLLHGAPGHIILVWSHQLGSTPYQDHDVYINTDLIIPPDLSASRKVVEPAITQPDGVLTYTLNLLNDGLAPTLAQLADPIPQGSAFSGGLWASSGRYGYEPASKTITWTGTISSSGQVTLTFQISALLSLSDGDRVTNTAWLTDGVNTSHALVAAARVDALPPISTIQNPVNGQIISSTDCLASGSATDTVIGVEQVLVSADGGPWLPASGRESWTFQWNGLDDGQHTLRSQAVDWLGHVELSGSCVTITVDAIAPELVAFYPVSGSANVPVSATIVLTFSEPIVSGTLAYAVTSDPGGWLVQWNSTRTVAFLSHADFSPGQTSVFSVLQARDQAANSLAPVQWIFTTSCQAVQTINLYGPSSLWAAETGIYVAAYTPPTATPPVTLTWSNGTVGPSAAYSWTNPGEYVVVVTATNLCAQLAQSLPVNVRIRPLLVYLPLILSEP